MMSAEAKSFSDLSALQLRKDQTPPRLFLTLTMILPTGIVIINFIIGVLTPITAGADDDMTLIDGVWRLVQGQHLGVDFYDPKGFGLFQVAALLWHLVGPHYYVIRASADLFALIIIICAAIVAARQLRQATGLAALFCVTVAFIASGPSLYGLNGYNGMDAYFGLTIIYDRLLVAGLLVLFVQSFANDLYVRPQHGYIDRLIAAVLLNTLFLAKISGLVIGLAIVVLGSILRGPFWRNLVGVSMVFLLLAGMVAIDFAVTGTSFSGLIHEYRMAAQGRVGAVSPQEVLWFARRPRILGVVFLMVLFVISRPIKGLYKYNWQRCCFIIGFYWICQVVLNMSNGSGTGGVGIAPAAAVAIVTWTDQINPGSFWNRLWSRVDASRLDGRATRKLIPLLILALVLMPEAYASLKAVKLDHAISFGNARSFKVSADKGITLNIAEDANPSVPYLRQGIYAIELLEASHDKIATLDSNNPFPALFLAPDPKGVWVWWDFTPGLTNVPIEYKPSWQEVIGDACIVMEPKQSPSPVKYYSEPLIKAVAPHLAAAFTPVYEDGIWKVWKYNSGCSVAGGQAGSSLQDKNNAR